MLCSFCFLMPFMRVCYIFKLPLLRIFTILVFISILHGNTKFIYFLQQLFFTVQHFRILSLRYRTFFVNNIFTYIELLLHFGLVKLRMITLHAYLHLYDFFFFRFKFIFHGYLPIFYFLISRLRAQFWIHRKCPCFIKSTIDYLCSFLLTVKILLATFTFPSHLSNF